MGGEERMRRLEKLVASVLLTTVACAPLVYKPDGLDGLRQHVVREGEAHEHYGTGTTHTKTYVLDNPFCDGLRLGLEYLDYEDNDARPDSLILRLQKDGGEVLYVRDRGVDGIGRGGDVVMVHNEGVLGECYPNTSDRPNDLYSMLVKQIGDL